MRITFVVGRLDLSGGSRIIATYAKMLAEHGHRVTVVAPVWRPAPLRKRIRSLLSGGDWDPDHGRPSHFHPQPGVDIRTVDRSEVTEADVPDADVVVATWWETAEWVNRFGPAKGAKVYFVQGHEVFDELRIDRVRATYRMPFSKIVVSGWLQRIMAQEYGDASAVLVPNAIDHGAFEVPPRGKQPVPTVGFMYHRAELKGVGVIVEAIQRLRQQLPALRVRAFGAWRPDGLESLGRIEYHHLPKPRQLRETYAGCDVWLSASRSEGFGLPVMEAMACRTPVVATPVGWPVDALQHGVNGYLVPPSDAQALAASALACLQLDDAAWRAMSDRAHATARSHDWNRAYEMFAAALEAAHHAPTKEP